MNDRSKSLMEAIYRCGNNGVSCRRTDCGWPITECVEKGALAVDAAVPLVKGPTTYTTACDCDSLIQGYHRMNCGVYGASSVAGVPCSAGDPDA